MRLSYIFSLHQCLYFSNSRWTLAGIKLPRGSGGRVPEPRCPLFCLEANRRLDTVGAWLRPDPIASAEQILEADAKGIIDIVGQILSPDRDRLEIGRETSRERVCQYE